VVIPTRHNSTDVARFIDILGATAHLDREKSARDAAEWSVMEARWGAAMVIEPLLEAAEFTRTIEYTST
jgi:hypothetical protein